MVFQKQWNGKTIYICEECKLGFDDKKVAKDCEDFCLKYRSCSIDITKKAIYRPEE